jgi:hypothetical protein
MSYKRPNYIWLGLCCLLLGASGTAWAECNDNDQETLAAAVLDLSGQGNFKCADLAGLGQGMADITDQITVTTDPSSNSLNWSLPLESDTEADAVFLAPASGARCLYLYPQNAQEGFNLTAGGKDIDKTEVIACTDGVAVEEPPPEPEEPLSTALNGCEGQIRVCPPDNPDCADFADFDVFIAHSLDGAAVCLDTASGQKQCVNQCIPVEPTEDCGPGVYPGELLLSCSRCELSSEEAELPYCWEYEQKVVREGEGDVQGLTPRSNGTFIPQVARESTSSHTTFFTGSTCQTTTILLNGRYYTYTDCGN